MAQLTVTVDAIVIKPPLHETHGPYVLTRRQVPEANHKHLWEIKRGDETLHVGDEAYLRQIILATLRGSK